MGLTKVFINKAMKKRGEIAKRTKAEVVDQIKFLTDKYGKDASNTIKTLLWCLGYSPLDSEEIASEIATPKKQMPLHGEKEEEGLLKINTFLELL